MNGGNCVDLVVCLDATGKQAPLFDDIKEKIMSLPIDIAAKMNDRNENIEQFRVKVISFRDYAFDDEPMVESDFYSLPEQMYEFCSYVNSIEAKGGGDSPENVLEAIALAMQSDWTQGVKKCVQKIIVMTTSEPLELGKHKDISKTPYPQNIPSSIEELKDLWLGKSNIKAKMDTSIAEMIVPIADDCEIWREISTWRGCTVNIRNQEDSLFSDDSQKATEDQPRRTVAIAMSHPYYIDVVMCIDATGSMSPIIDELKANAMSFSQKFLDALEEVDVDIAQLRTKVITFRDYGCDHDAMNESQFFTLPDQNDAFSAFINSIEAKGGGDVPENALEAISLALKSDWTTEGAKRRQVIVVLSDAPAHPLGKRADCCNYPVGLPESFEHLSRWWEGIDATFCGTYQPRRGRLLAFVPHEKPWTDMECWNRYWPEYSRAGTGLQEIDFDRIIELLVDSIWL